MKPRFSPAVRFVIGIGLVSLFADFTYEGGRSIIGPYLAVLGAGPILVGVVAGAGEFFGYAIRFVSGRFADRTGRHWAIMGTGYTVNLLAVPALALVASAPAAAGLVFAERLGKGVRNPARDALLSRAGQELGHGRAFALHEFLDQLGALIGPLVVAGVTALAAYRFGFAVLLAPALAALATGRLFDRYGQRVLYVLPLLTLPAAPLLFLTQQVWIWIGTAFWGAALGVQESTMRAAVAALTPEEIRASAYGTFDTAFGSAWMLGSIVMGGLYGLQPVNLVGFSVLLQLAALQLLARVPMGGPQ